MGADHAEYQDLASAEPIISHGITTWSKKHCLVHELPYGRQLNWFDPSTPTTNLHQPAAEKAFL